MCTDMTSLFVGRGGRIPCGALIQQLSKKPTSEDEWLKQDSKDLLVEHNARESDCREEGKQHS